MLNFFIGLFIGFIVAALCNGQINIDLTRDK